MNKLYAVNRSEDRKMITGVIMGGTTVGAGDIIHHLAKVGDMEVKIYRPHM